MVAADYIEAVVEARVWDLKRLADGNPRALLAGLLICSDLVAQERHESLGDERTTAWLNDHAAARQHDKQDMGEWRRMAVQMISDRLELDNENRWFTKDQVRLDEENTKKLIEALSSIVILGVIDAVEGSNSDPKHAVADFVHLLRTRGVT
jgi:hypothetical protein